MTKEPAHRRKPSEEYDRFASLMKRLVQVPKTEIKKAEEKLKHRSA